jgi:hypothetical protein
MRLSKEEKRKKALLFAENKHTHNWQAAGAIDRMTGSYRPMMGFCKACGIHYQLFKAKPAPCPQNPNTEQVEELPK